MKIGIIGGGAIGLLFAARLSDNHRVRLYTRTEKQAAALLSEGLELIDKEGSCLKRRMTARGIGSGLSGEEELIIVAVKQYQLPQLLESMKGLEVPFLFLQNGYGHITYLEEFLSQHIYIGVVEHGALKHGPNSVEHTGMGVTRVAAYKGNLDFLNELNIDPDKFGFIKGSNYREIMIDKLVVNCVINPLTAVLGAKNGELLKNPFYSGLFEGLFEEVAAVLELSEPEKSLEHVKSVCIKTAGNKSSMLKDLEDGRETEIDAMLGYVLSEAAKKEVKLHLASSLYKMVKGKEIQGG